MRQTVHRGFQYSIQPCRSEAGCISHLEEEIAGIRIVRLAINTHSDIPPPTQLSVMSLLRSLIYHQSSKPQPPTPVRQDLCEVSHSEHSRSERISIYRQTCGKRQKFVGKDGTVHPYCGRTCAKAQQPTCKLPGCSGSGRTAFSGFCSPRHER